MKKRNKIITIATIAALSLTASMNCVAITLAGKDSPRHSHGAQVKPMATQHATTQKAFSAIKDHETKARDKARKTMDAKRNISRDGLDKTRAAQINKIIAAHAESAKARIKKIPTATQYTATDRDADAATIDTIKTQFIIKQND